MERCNRLIKKFAIAEEVRGQWLKFYAINIFGVLVVSFDDCSSSELSNHYIATITKHCVEEVLKPAKSPLDHFKTMAGHRKVYT